MGRSASSLSGRGGAVLKVQIYRAVRANMNSISQFHYFYKHWIEKAITQINDMYA